MRDFRFLVDPLFLHNVRAPLLILAVLFVLLVLAACVLVAVHLRRGKAQREPRPQESLSEEPPCV